MANVWNFTPLPWFQTFNKFECKMVNEAVTMVARRRYNITKQSSSGTKFGIDRQCVEVTYIFCSNE